MEGLLVQQERHEYIRLRYEEDARATEDPWKTIRIQEPWKTLGVGIRRRTLRERTEGG